MIIISAIRKSLMSHQITPQPFIRLSANVHRAETLIIAYYATSIYLAAQLLYRNNDLLNAQAAWDFLWPIFWLERVNADIAIELIGIASILSSVVALIFRESVWARAAFFVTFFFAATVPNSLGGINHPYHAWFWVGAIFMCLPSGDPQKFNRAEKMSYLTTVLTAQALILLFYTMAGAWKIVIGLIALIGGVPGNFSFGALSWTLADRVVQTGTDPLLADFVITNPEIAWILFGGVMYIQLFAVVAAFRPRLHILWGLALISFHIGTWVLMDIIFTEHIVLLAILFLLSPQGRMASSVVEVLRDTPIFGAIISRHWTNRQRRFHMLNDN